MSVRVNTIPAEAAGTGTLGIPRGVAMYVGAVMGPGVLALPQLAAAHAGPSSIVAWTAMLLLSVPVAFTFAALASRYPDAGGVATFARRAFGDRCAAVVGWVFFSVIPIGGAAASYVGARYVADALGWGTGGVTALMIGFVVLAFAANHAGLRLSGGAQLVLLVLLTGLLSVATIAAMAYVEPTNFEPFAPHGFGGVLSAAGVLFFAFAGWEAATHLSGEFADPRRQLRKVAAYSLLIVAAIYMGLSVVSIGVLGPEAARTPVPLTRLLSYALGPAAAPLTAVVATVLTLGAMNTFIASASRLAAALARDGAMPAALAKGGEPGATPHRGIVVLAVLTGLVVAVSLLWSVDVDGLMRVTSGCLAAVTVVGTAAAVVLLSGRALRAMALVACAFSAVILVSLGWFLVVPVSVALLALGHLTWLGRGSDH